MSKHHIPLATDENTEINVSQLDRYYGETLSQRRCVPPYSTQMDEVTEESSNDVDENGHNPLEDISFYPIAEFPSILGQPIAIGDDEVTYTSDLMKGLGRTKERAGIQVPVIFDKVTVKLPPEWYASRPSQNVTSTGSVTRLRYDGEAKMFVNILKRHSHYCCWDVFENYFRKPGSRKSGCVHFRAWARCTLNGCKHSAVIIVEKPTSSSMHIVFNGEFYYQRGQLAAKGITGRERDKLATYFANNPSVPPSGKYREELLNIDSASFAAGDMTGPGTTNTTYQQAASTASQAANSYSALKEKILNLKDRLAREDKEESISLQWTFRTEFGWIQKPVINPGALQVVLMDQIMAMLSHEHITNDVLYIDATGSVTNQIKWISKVFYYVAVIRHPYGKTLPIAEYVTNKHDQFSIGDFLKMIHEREYRKHGETMNQRMVMTDFSWAIILACLKQFCNESITEYLNRSYRQITEIATQNDLGKTLLHVCLAHMMKLNKKHAVGKKSPAGTKKSQVHLQCNFFNA